MLALAAPYAAQAAEPPVSGHAVFDRTVRLVWDNFYDESALDKFGAAVRAEIEDSTAPINAQTPEARIDEAIDSVLASLNASHMGRYTPDDIEYFELTDIFRFAVRRDLRRLFPPEGEVNYPGVGFIARNIDGKLFVSDVYDGSPAAKADISVGDEVLSVDGAPYDDIASFTDKTGKEIEVSLRRREGEAPFTVKLKVEQTKPLRSFERAIKESAKIVERDGRKIGYVHIWTLSTPDGMRIIAREIVDGALKEADGLVVDLRGRWGGGEADAAEMFVGDTPDFRLVERDGDDILANIRWRKPVVGIIDEGARSGLEVFAYGLKVNGIPLVGTHTAGALLAGRGFLLPDDSLLIVAVNDAILDTDVRLEGKGVEPDIHVPFNLPYAAGSDPQFDAAVNEMSRVLGEGND
ncbi:MAG TPA: S41 family peptidase [Rhizobiaceae bacterium]|nr:S41 family peptidase [Rhizobiaceae bacterium]